METWLSPVVDDHVVHLDGISIIRQDRNINGDGVALYVCSDFNVVKLVSSNTEGLGLPGSPEFLFCSVQQGESPPILVGVIYRSPKTPTQKDSKKKGPKKKDPNKENLKLFDVLKELSMDYSSKIIMGDLNAN